MSPTLRNRLHQQRWREREASNPNRRRVVYLRILPTAYDAIQAAKGDLSISEFCREAVQQLIRSLNGKPYRLKSRRTIRKRLAKQAKPESLDLKPVDWDDEPEPSEQERLEIEQRIRQFTRS